MTFFLLASPAAQAIKVPVRSFSVAEFRRVERATARRGCLANRQGQEGCVSYDADCRRYSHGRIECYGALVMVDGEGRYLELFNLRLYYPSRTNDERFPYSISDSNTEELDGPRCPVKAKAFLCHGPWTWHEKRHEFNCGSTEPVCDPRPALPARLGFEPLDLGQTSKRGAPVPPTRRKAEPL
jgi:hypothetical protein